MHIISVQFDSNIWSKCGNGAGCEFRATSARTGDGISDRAHS